LIVTPQASRCSRALFRQNTRVMGAGERGKACNSQRYGQAMTDVQVTAAITHEGDWYVARCLQVEVTSQGETVEVALANLREALELYFEDEPLPAAVQVPMSAPVEISIRAA
jgi:predicted RNase H-like HicB family nuclease